MRCLGLLLALAVISSRAASAGDVIEPPEPSSYSVELLPPRIDLVLEPEWMLAPLPHEPSEFLLPEPLIELLPWPESELVEPDPEKPIDRVMRIWELRFEYGLNGSSGNSDRFATRYGGKARRKTVRNLLTLDLLYSNSYANGRQNENKLLFDGRSEWPWQDSPWFYYTHGTTEYDEFTAFDVRVTSDSGIGYQYIKTDVTQFKGRVGAGFSQEIQSPDEHFIPEGTVGLSLEHKLTPQHKVIAAGDVFPDLRDIGDFRAKSTAAYEVKIDPQYRLSVRFGVIDRYDSTPNGKKKNDLDYSSLIVWEF